MCGAPPVRLADVLQSSGNVGALDAIDGLLRQRGKQHVEIPLGADIRARSQRLPLGIEIPGRNVCHRQLDSRGGTARLGTLSRRIGPELSLGKPLPGNPAGVVKLDLAHIAQALTTLLRAYPVLDDPALGIAANPAAKSRQSVVP